MTDFQIPHDRHQWGATAADYNKHADGSPLSMVQSSGVSSFPGVGAAVGGSGQDVARASRRLKLPSDRWPVHPSAKLGSDIAKLLRGGVQVSIDRPTCDILSSADLLERLMKDHHHYVIADHKVVNDETSTSQKSSVRTERVQFGPLLARTSSSDGDCCMELVPPLSVYDSRQTAAGLHLVHKDQNHAICRKDPRLISDFKAALWQRNDVKGITEHLDWWSDVLKDIKEGNIDTDDPRLDQHGPSFFIGSSGGSPLTAAQKGCPSFGSSVLSKDSPDGFLPGGQKDTAENRALASIAPRKVCVLRACRINLRFMVSHCFLLSLFSYSFW